MRVNLSIVAMIAVDTSWFVYSAIKNTPKIELNILLRVNMFSSN